MTRFANPPRMDLRAKIPPVPVALLAGGVMWLMDRFTCSRRVALPTPRLMEAAFAGTGALIAALGVVAFRQAHTTVNPVHPGTASQLVTTGVYGVTRNPMYLGLLLLLAAYAVHLANPFAILGLVAFVAYLNRFQIAPEEAALTALFGAEYAAYQRRVRRWL
jgi:protein-S-isoprenylcysteine O-methyltransferase Ste14